MTFYGSQREPEGPRRNLAAGGLRGLYNGLGPLVRAGELVGTGSGSRVGGNAGSRSRRAWTRYRRRVDHDGDEKRRRSRELLARRRVEASPSGAPPVVGLQIDVP